MSGPPSGGFDLFSLLFVLKLPDNCSNDDRATKYNNFSFCITIR